MIRVTKKRAMNILIETLSIGKDKSKSKLANKIISNKDLCRLLLELTHKKYGIAKYKAGQFIIVKDDRQLTKRKIYTVYNDGCSYCLPGYNDCESDDIIPFENINFFSKETHGTLRLNDYYCDKVIW